MAPFLYVQEEYENVRRALDESLRYDYGPGQTVDYYEECRFRLDGIQAELERLGQGGAAPVSAIVSQLWDLANRLTLIERSHLGEFSWPFADAIRVIASPLLLENEGLEGGHQPIIHMIAEGTSYQITSEKVMGPNKRRRLYTVAFPRQLKHHVLMHALFGHELGHATFYSSRASDLFSSDPLSIQLTKILRREGHLRDAASVMAWLRSEDAPERVKQRMKGITAVITEASLEHWIVELICDLFGLAIFGPAFVAAHRTYLEPSCKNPHQIEIEKTSHPSYALRRSVLVSALRVLGWLDPVATAANSELLNAERSLIDYIGGPVESWTEVFTPDQLCEAMATISRHFNATGTPLAQRPSEDVLADLVGRIGKHLPPIREEVDEEGVSTTHPVRLEEQLYAGWTYWLGHEALDAQPLDFYSLNQLCDLALLQQQAIDLSAGRRKL
ncbi:hypothetical protein M2336_000759 [Sphingobium sp. B1D7B]|uniref:hypothetical protein n=1 Tax=unclassified Sphingobium TaxID=2611147 RepID=UPI0022248258|nr:MULTISPECIES: hypothetical protein [unclassified Sphingobium]MCW2392435.1 hypothetical protein [Sphingobium sp. B11D3A]MCW2404130.1 hypothetical protein [Sphingobium sp. B1D7B]